MALHVIAYDLDSPAYGPLSAAIKSIGPWAKALESQWLVITSKNHREIIDILSPCVATPDRLLVVAVEPCQWMARNLPEHVVRWLNSCTRHVARGARRPLRLQPR